MQEAEEPGGSKALQLRNEQAIADANDASMMPSKLADTAVPDIRGALVAEKQATPVGAADDAPVAVRAEAEKLGAKQPLPGPPQPQPHPQPQPQPQPGVSQPQGTVEAVGSGDRRDANGKGAPQTLFDRLKGVLGGLGWGE